MRRFKVRLNSADGIKLSMREGERFGSRLRIPRRTVSFPLVRNGVENAICGPCLRCDHPQRLRWRCHCQTESLARIRSTISARWLPAARSRDVQGASRRDRRARPGGCRRQLKPRSGRRSAAVVFCQILAREKIIILAPLKIKRGRHILVVRNERFSSHFSLVACSPLDAFAFTIRRAYARHFCIRMQQPGISGTIGPSKT